MTWLTPSRKLCNVTTEGRREGWREEVVELPNPLHWAVEEPGARDDDAAETTEAARELSPVCDRCGFDGRRKFELSGMWADEEATEPSGLDGRGEVDVARKVVPKLTRLDADCVWNEKLGRPA